jgi:predicted secreted protein
MEKPAYHFARAGARLAIRVWRRLAGRGSGQDPKAARDFDRDGRSKNVIFVAHCVLNQNARDSGTADSPAMMKPLLAALMAEDIGIIQLPCPELVVLGLGRDRGVPPLPTIREKLELPESQLQLGILAGQVIDQINEYRRHGFHVIGILAKEGSPTCGASDGVFLRLLRQRLSGEGLDIGIKGIDDQSQQEAIEWVLQRLPRRTQTA